MEHTKGELSVSKDANKSTVIMLLPKCCSGGSYLLARMNPIEGFDNKAHAERLVKCWNEHDVLQAKAKLLDELVKYARHKGYCNIAQCISVEYTGRNAETIKCNCGWTVLKQKIAKAEELQK